ncbi:MAG TPA: alpha/beta hydrolase [Anaerolineae bacterium]|nr:alpha/beta hydrolase [Anaerolineae bacterium]
MKKGARLSILTLLGVTTACAGSTPSPTPLPPSPWVEEEVTFSFGANQLYGILTLPTGGGPFPAIVLVSGSINTSTGVRSGALSPYLIDHAHNMVLRGFAVLRYDPPGVGQSSGESGFEPLDLRAEEAAAALQFLRSRPDIRPDRVGLWGESQGAWVIAKAAARYAQDVAFVISVSGSGVSVAAQQWYSIEAQSRAAGMTEEEVVQAALFGRVLIDWQLATPTYREENEEAAQYLGKEGPWTQFMALVYEPGEITPAESLRMGLEILKSVQDEPWAKFLYLKELYIPQLESIPPDQVEALGAVVGPTMLEDPGEYWTKVQCPVLAIWGEDDLLQPTARSARLYEYYLTQAGNKRLEKVVLPGVGHSISMSTRRYREELSKWLDELYPE